MNLVRDFANEIRKVETLEELVDNISILVINQINQQFSEKYTVVVRWIYDDEELPDPKIIGVSVSDGTKQDVFFELEDGTWNKGNDSIQTIAGSRLPENLKRTLLNEIYHWTTLRVEKIEAYEHHLDSGLIFLSGEVKGQMIFFRRSSSPGSQWIGSITTKI